MDYQNLSEFLDILDPPLQVKRWVANIFMSSSFSSVLKAKQVQDNQHEHPNREMDKPHDERSPHWQGVDTFQKSFTEIFVSKVFCSDILDAITKDFFARKQHTHDDTMHVEDLQVLHSPQKIYM